MSYFVYDLRQTFESELQLAFANALLAITVTIQEELEQPLHKLTHCRNSMTSKSLDIKLGQENLVCIEAFDWNTVD